MRRSWNHILFTLAVIGCTAVLTVLLPATPTLAQKGKPQPPPPPPPPGKIYFTNGGPGGATPIDFVYPPWGITVRQWSMNADGTNLRKLNYDEHVLRPSNRLYGNGYRWSLFGAETGEVYERYISSNLSNYGNVMLNRPHYELFACRPDGAGGFQVVQITTLFGAAIVLPNGFVARWSNDGNDSFLSFVAHDISEAWSPDPDDPENEILDLRIAPKSIIRVPVSALELDAAANAGSFTPLGPDECELVLSTDNYLSQTDGSCAHSWSPDGSMVAFVEELPDLATGQDLFVMDVSSGATLPLWDAPSADPKVMSTVFPVWRPQGNQILYSDGVSRLIMADGSGGAPTPSGLDYAWSPDGRHTLWSEGGQVKIKGVWVNRTFYYRYDWQTSTTTKITDVEPGVIHAGHRYWVSNNSAP